jgi:hypothetical protein
VEEFQTFSISSKHSPLVPKLVPKLLPNLVPIINHIADTLAIPPPFSPTLHHLHTSSSKNGI